LPVSLSPLKSQIRKCMQKATDENEEAHETNLQAAQKVALAAQRAPLSAGA
jgi:hypothetical protein